MNPALFNNEIDNKNMTEGIGARRLSELVIEKEEYEREIEIALETCGDILQSNDARCNFIAEIYELEQEMENEIDESLKQSIVSNVKDLTSELTKLLKNVPREIGERLAFFSKQIIDRRERTEKTNLEIKDLLDEYPGLENVDRIKKYRTLEHIFAVITSYTGEKFVIESLTPKYERKEVLGIKKASNIFLEKVGLIEINYTEKLERPITNTSGLFGFVNNAFSNDEPLTDTKDINKIFDIEDDLVDEVVVYNPEDELVETKITSLFEESEELDTEIEKVIEFPNQDIVKEEKVTPISEELDTDFGKVIESPSQDTISEENVTPNSEEVSEITNEETIPFYMTGEYTLAELATAVCEDPAGWIDIYEANKKEFDEIINIKNNGTIEGIENNKELFKGLTINVPMEFNKGQSHEQDQTLGMAS